MPQTVGCPGSAVAVEAEIFFLEDGLEKLALPLGKDEVGGSEGTPLFANDSIGLGPFRGRGHAIHARRAEPAFKSTTTPFPQTYVGPVWLVPAEKGSVDDNIRMTIPVDVSEGNGLKFVVLGVRIHGAASEATASIGMVDVDA